MSCQLQGWKHLAVASWNQATDQKCAAPEAGRVVRPIPVNLEGSCRTQACRWAATFARTCAFLCAAQPSNAAATCASAGTFQETSLDDILCDVLMANAGSTNVCRPVTPPKHACSHKQWHTIICPHNTLNIASESCAKLAQTLRHWLSVGVMSGSSELPWAQTGRLRRLRGYGRPQWTKGCCARPC